MRNKTDYNCDYLIIGAGIMGMTIAYEILEELPTASIAIIEKEAEVGKHASGRNSGVLHAGFYYTPDSLKARFTRDGNRLMKEFCKANGININNCKKVVVAKDEEELQSLFELERRGRKNGVDLALISEEELHEIEPNAKTYRKALYSPTTATVDPLEVCLKIKEVLQEKGVRFFLDCRYTGNSEDNVFTTRGIFSAGFIINTAGLYADLIARDFGFSRYYTIIPFKGRYLKYNGDDMPVKMNIYPVPNLKNPFLGIHYTITSNNEVKIGPSAMPAFWRENYGGLSKFNLNEFLNIIYFEFILFVRNSFNFRSLAWSEIKKSNKKYFSGLAKKLVLKCDIENFNQWAQPGIRAQLLNKRTFKLEMDFIMEGDERSLHVLNAVSPAFTCSFALAKYIVKEKLPAEIIEQRTKQVKSVEIN
ncbi:L-2-hydroxyglutarate oxidase [Gramella lutea]|uniref:L-2-hydroxyglutarate oxidase n=1 Tax=Christiangramia lutea TaxID=1607951 RepID=A0A9X1V4Q1_9FLAO|nr:L-2-hydroxyglutarate oxidase [Christiangramia lutea]MCH4822749.1 L-2-hydroxyglutarate oxidase [Christiangramia lutea]